VRHGFADRGIGIEDDVPGGVVGQADGQRGDQLAAAGLGYDPAAQPGPDEMQLGFLCGHPRYADQELADIPVMPTRSYEYAAGLAGIVSRSA
jgi:hypothetical protein